MCLKRMCPVDPKIGKRNTHARKCERISLVACMDCIASWYITTQNFSIMGAAVTEIRDRGAHVQAQAPLFMDCLTRISSGSIYPHTTFQRNASSRFRDTDKGQERAHVQMHPTLGLCKTHSQWVPNHTPNFSAILRTVPNTRKRGTHFRMCICTPLLTSVKSLANWYLTKRPNFSAIRPAVLGIRKAGVHLHVCTSARADGIWILPIHYQCDMHRYLDQNHTSNLVPMGRAIPELQLSDLF